MNRRAIGAISFGENTIQKEFTFSADATNDEINEEIKQWVKNILEFWWIKVDENNEPIAFKRTLM